MSNYIMSRIVFIRIYQKYQLKRICYHSNHNKIMSIKKKHKYIKKMLGYLYKKVLNRSSNKLIVKLNLILVKHHNRISLVHYQSNLLN
jgi:hypothetical protein